MFKIAMILLVCLLFFGGVKIGASPPEVKTPLVGVSSAQASYREGETAAFAITILNRKNTAVKLIFPSSRKYDFILSQDGKQVWKWSHDFMFAQSLTHLTLEPGQPVTDIVMVKRFQAASGGVLPPGLYELQACLCLREGEILSKPIPFEIKEN